MSEPAQASVLQEGLDVGIPSPCNIKDMSEAVHVKDIDFPFMSSTHCQSSSIVQKVTSDTSFVDRDVVVCLPDSILSLFIQQIMHKIRETTKRSHQPRGICLNNYNKYCGNMKTVGNSTTKIKTKTENTYVKTNSRLCGEKI